MTHDIRLTDRRRFLADAGIGLAGLWAAPAALSFVSRAPALAPRAKPPTLVVIYLRGGADALNIVVPWADKTYHEVRPSIAIPAETTDDEPGVIKLDKKVGLHPAMAALKPFWDSKQLAPIVNVGSPHPTRSHFEAQDFMEYAAPGDRSVRDGWLNRYLRETKAGGGTPLRALAFQGLLPRSLRGETPVLAVPRLRRDGGEELCDLFGGVYEGGGDMGEAMGADSRPSAGAASEVAAVGRKTIETLRRFWDITEADPAAGTEGKYPDDGFAQRLRMLARVIKHDEGLEVAALDVGGWDHHQGEGASDGALNRLLKTISDGIGAFASDLGQHLERTCVLVMSEFGRTVAENGNRGTDHGRGGMMLLLGGRVNGGKVYGDYGSLEPRKLQDGRDLRVESDFRTVFSETLEGLFGFKAPKSFFPLWTPREKLSLFKPA